MDTVEQRFIYYGQYEGVSFGSRVIRFFTWSNISHTAAFFPPNEQGEYGDIIEAWREGVVRRHWTEGHKKGTKITIYKVACTKFQQDKFYALMQEKIGKKYDFLGVIGFPFRKIWESPNRWFCSEAVYHSALLAGILLFKNIQAYQVFPGLLSVTPYAEEVGVLTI
jgi:hypothetical protein